MTMGHKQVSSLTEFQKTFFGVKANQRIGANVRNKIRIGLKQELAKNWIWDKVRVSVRLSLERHQN